MNILVTGAKGFVGKNLVENLKNIRDGKNWVHPDTIKEVGTKDNDSAIGMASSYGLKNRMLFVVNNPFCVHVFFIADRV